MTEPETKFAQWARVEIFGHQVHEGFVSEATTGGCSFVRVDVPPRELEESVWNDSSERYNYITRTHPGYTKYFGQDAVFSITPFDPEKAKELDAKYGAQTVPDTSGLLSPPAGESSVEGRT